MNYESMCFLTFKKGLISIKIDKSQHGTSNEGQQGLLHFVIEKFSYIAKLH